MRFTTSIALLGALAASTSAVAAADSAIDPAAIGTYPAFLAYQAKISEGTATNDDKAQLAATEMFYDPADAVAQASSADLPTTMTNVAEFLFDKGILGEGAPSADFVGVAYPDGSTSGDANNVKFRYDATYMQMAADGEL